MTIKYSELNLGQMEAVVNKLGGMDGVQKFLRGELTVSELIRSWREEDGVIYFSVTSDGTTGPQWISRLEENGFRLSKWVKDTLNSPDFTPTKGVTTEIAVLKGELLSDRDRVTHKIRAEAEKRKLAKPNAEVACLIRENFSNEELKAMGLYWIVVMHDAIKDSDGGPFLLASSRDGDGRYLYAYYDEPDYSLSCRSGFAFAVCK